METKQKYSFGSKMELPLWHLRLTVCRLLLKNHSPRQFVLCYAHTLKLLMSQVAAKNERVLDMSV